MRQLVRFVREAWNLVRILPAGDYLRWVWLCVRLAPQIVRTGSLAPVDFAFGTTIRFRAGGRWIEVNVGALGVVREIVASRCYGESSDLREARQILDLGANCGVFTLYALASAPSATVTAIEIQPSMVDATLANVARNGFESRGRVEIGCAGDLNDTIAGLFAGRNPPPRFDCDAYIATVGTCDFLKCDVEGSEFGLFTDGSKWLRGVRRAAIEYHGDWESGRKLGRVLELHGFSVVQKPHGPFGYLLATRRWEGDVKNGMEQEASCGRT